MCMGENEIAIILVSVDTVLSQFICSGLRLACKT